MKYIKIPLRHHVPASQLNVADNEKENLYQLRELGILADIRAGYIPSWAVSYEDLKNVQIEGDHDSD